MTAFHVTTLKLLTHELEQQRRNQTDATTTVARWQQEMPSMGTSITDMQKRSDEFGAVIADLERLIAVVQGAADADDDEPWDECPDQFYAPTIVESYVRHAIEGQAGR